MYENGQNYIYHHIGNRRLITPRLRNISINIFLPLAFSRLHGFSSYDCPVRYQPSLLLGCSLVISLL